MSKKKFQQIWASATDIGRRFGISAVEVHQRLQAAGLRDEHTRAPTEKAVAAGWAISTPLRDGTPHFMWNATKVSGLLRQGAQELDAREVAFEAFLRDVLALEREASETGSDKALYVYIDECLDAVRGTPAQFVASACWRLNVNERALEFCHLVDDRRREQTLASDGQAQEELSEPAPAPRQRG